MFKCSHYLFKTRIKATEATFDNPLNINIKLFARISPAQRRRTEGALCRLPVGGRGPGAGAVRRRGRGLGGRPCAVLQGLGVTRQGWGGLIFKGRSRGPRQKTLPSSVNGASVLAWERSAGTHVTLARG